MDLEDLEEFIVSTYLPQQMQADLDPDVDLLETKIIDSMGIMRLIAFIEKNANIRVPLSDLKKENFRSMRIILAYVGKLQEG